MRQPTNLQRDPNDVLRGLLDKPAAPPKPSAPVKAARSAPVKAARSAWYDRLPVVLIGLPIFAGWWIMGGKYTIDGTPLLINMLLDFLRLGARVSPITDGRWYALLAWLPILVSIIERRNRPRRGLAFTSTTVVVLAVWAIASLYDLGTTYIAVTTPAPDAWLLTQQIGAYRPVAALWTGATTFLPEIGIVALLRYLWRG